jgi:hypothetical protein
MPISEARILDWVERGRVPDPVVRAGIRQRLKKMATNLPGAEPEAAWAHKRAFIALMDASPWPRCPERANEQHYEVPAEFFDIVLGPRASTAAAGGRRVWTTWPRPRRRRWRPPPSAPASPRIRTCWNSAAAGARSASGRRSAFRPAASRRCPTPPPSAPSSKARRRRGIGNLTVITCDMNVFDTDAALRPHRVAGDVRAHAQLAGAVRPRQRLAQARVGASSCTCSATASIPTPTKTPAPRTG